METFLRFVLGRFIEPIYFALFMIIGKDLKNKRLLLTCIMMFQYLMLTSIIKFDVLFHFLYTFMVFIDLKVLYREKAQITDIFLFGAASITLIIVSIITYLTALYTYQNYIIAMIINRVVIFSAIYFCKNKIRKLYKRFYSLWNRHNNPKSITSLTLRNISTISFNLMFAIINLCMVYVKLR